MGSIHTSEKEIYATSLTYAPMRSQPGHRFEQVSQLLMGEKVQILQQNGEWSFVELYFDGYTGWVETKVLHRVVNNQFAGIIYPKTCKSTALKTIFGYKVDVPCGAEFDGVNNTLFDALPHEVDWSADSLSRRILRLSEAFLGTPYLWGGRTGAGIDCSGLVQVIFKAWGICLPRDASQQAGEGDAVKNLSEALPADLAFFSNNEGKITHVGILNGEGQIIHASGWVRMDNIDETGIFTGKHQHYTHRLHSIRRLV